MRTAALLAGVAMAGYLLARPYPDDFASPWWIVSHTLGMVGFVALAVLGDRAGGRVRPLLTLGAALVLPYYGAETFGLAAGADPEAFRMQPVALGMFLLGLAAVAAGGLLLARRTTAAVPLGVLMALVLPQFWLPPVGRMGFGVLFLAAAVWFAVRTPVVSERPQPGGDGGGRTVLEPVQDRGLAHE